MPPSLPSSRLTEYAFKAVRSSNLTSVAVRGADCVVMVSQKKVQDKLIDETSVTSMYPISKHIGVCMTGMVGDAKAAVQRARAEAAKFEYENGFPIPVSLLAQKMADLAQLWTQQAFMRALGVVSIFCGIDDSTQSPKLYRVDPAGRYVSQIACAAGVKEQDASNYLEKKIKHKSSLSVKETLQLAITTLQESAGADLRPADVEVAIVTSADPAFRVLSEKEVDEVLSSIGERD